MATFNNPRKPGFNSVYQRRSKGLAYVVLTRSNRPEGASQSYIVETFDEDGEPARKQPRELWDGIWDTEEEAIKAIKDYLGESESL